MSSSQYDFIFDICAERLCLSSIFAIKMMFIQSSRYTHFQHDDWFKMKFIRLMSCWTEVVASPIIKEVAESHLVSSLFMPLFEDNTDSLIIDGNSVCGIHLYLLILASNHMLDQIKLGVGPKTSFEIKEWMELMESIHNEEYDILGLAGPGVRTMFLNMLQRHNDTCYEENSDSIDENPFFDHRLLFLHIAHLVNFYTKCELTGSLPSLRNAKEVNGISFIVWENSCGEVCNQLFDLNSHGLVNLVNCDFEDKTFSNEINLPYSQYADEFSDVLKDQVPNIHNMHQKVIEVFRNYVLKHHTTWDTQCDMLDFFFEKTTKRIASSKAIFSNRQKVQKALIKKKKLGSVFKPTIPQDHWQRDQFCLSNHSMMKMFKPYGKLVLRVDKYNDYLHDNEEHEYFFPEEHNHSYSNVSLSKSNSKSKSKSESKSGSESGSESDSKSDSESE